MADSLERGVVRKKSQGALKQARRSIFVLAAVSELVMG
jgi:hypothetical protein